MCTASTEPEQELDRSNQKRDDRSDIDALKQALEELNSQLVPGPTLLNQYGPEKLEGELRDFLGKIRRSGESFYKVYLADGGWSRITIHYDRGNVSLNLASNSSDEVKRRWESIQPK